MLIYFLLSNIFVNAQICKKLQVSSNINATKDDIIKNGVSGPMWDRQSKNPIIVPASQLIDFLYITVAKSDNDQQLLMENFDLAFDDHYFADSKISIDSSESENGKEMEYALEINYRFLDFLFLFYTKRCKEYGGTLVNYDLTINIPECGTAQIHWKKLCGNPLVNREGFSIDMVYKGYNATIVKDGLIVNASYFDQDIDNYVFVVPADINSTRFWGYMKSNTQYRKKEIKKNDEFQYLESVIRNTPAVNISKPFAETDENIALVSFEGPLQDGVRNGTVTGDKMYFDLIYQCQKRGRGTVELTIPLDYFKDVSLIFIKECLLGNKVEIVIEEEYESLNYTGFQIFVGFMIGLCLLGTCANLCIGHRQGLANIPLLTTIIRLTLFITCLRNTYESEFGKLIAGWIGLSIESATHKQDEDEETFSVKQKNFYGSI